MNNIKYIRANRVADTSIWDEFPFYVFSTASKSGIDRPNNTITLNKVDYVFDTIQYINDSNISVNASEVVGLSAFLDKKVNNSDIIDNLTSTDTNKPLSANQGKILGDKVKNKALLENDNANNLVKLPKKSNDATVRTGTEQFVIKDDGKVGIGTDTPTEQLEVNGNIKITGGNPELGKVLTSDANGKASWETSNATKLYDSIFRPTTPNITGLQVLGNRVHIEPIGITNFFIDATDFTNSGVFMIENFSGSDVILSGSSFTGINHINSDITGNDYTLPFRHSLIIEVQVNAPNQKYLNYQHSAGSLSSDKLEDLLINLNNTPFNANEAPILIVMGQSNSYGHNQTIPTNYRVDSPLANVYGLPKSSNSSITMTDVTWQNYQSNVEFNLGGSSSVNLTNIQNQVGRLWQEHIDSGNSLGLPDLYTVMIGQGGKGFDDTYDIIGQWASERPLEIPGALYKYTMRTLELTMKNLRNTGKIPRIIGVHWNQWEADASQNAPTGRLSSAQLYANNLNRFHIDLKKVLRTDFPFYLYKPISEVFDGSTSGVPGKNNREIVQEAIENYKKSSINIHLINATNYSGYNPSSNTKGIFASDRLHYNQFVQRYFADIVFNNIRNNFTGKYITEPEYVYLDKAGDNDIISGEDDDRYITVKGVRTAINTMTSEGNANITVDYTPTSALLGTFNDIPTIEASSTHNDGKFRIYSTPTEDRYENRINYINLKEGETKTYYIIGQHTNSSYVIGNKVELSIVNGVVEFTSQESKAEKINGTINKSYNEINDVPSSDTNTKVDWSPVLDIKVNSKSSVVVVNNLTSNSDTEVLAASVGKVLDDKKLDVTEYQKITRLNVGVVGDEPKLQASNRKTGHQPFDTSTNTVDFIDVINHFHTDPLILAEFNDYTSNKNDYEISLYVGDRRSEFPNRKFLVTNWSGENVNNLTLQYNNRLVYNFILTKTDTTLKITDSHSGNNAYGAVLGMEFKYIGTASSTVFTRRGLSENDYTDADKQKLDSLSSSGSSLNKATDTEATTGTDDTKYMTPKTVKVVADTKVDKVTGKGLSENDYTTTDKNKVSEIDNKEPAFTKNTAFNKNFGTGAGEVAEGNDDRLTFVSCWIEKDGIKIRGYNTGAITVSKYSIAPGYYKITHNYGRNINIQLTSISGSMVVGVSSVVDTHFDVQIKNTNGADVDALFFVKISR